MSSMSYCAIQNACTDLHQGLDKILERGVEDLSPDELSAAEEIVGLARELAEYLGMEDDE